MDRVGQAEVDIVADLSRFGKNLERDLQKAVDKVKIDTSSIGDGIGDGIEDGTRRAAKSLKGLSDSGREALDDTGDTAARVGKRIGDSFEEGYKRVRSVVSRLSNVLFTFRSRVIGLGAIIVIALAAVVAATDELLGLLLPLPALLAGVSAAVGTLNVALLGMGDAFKAAFEDGEKFEEAIANLAPAAQEVAREFRSLIPIFQGLRLDVQQAFWDGLPMALSKVSSVLLGPLRLGMTQVADAMGETVLEFAKFLSQGETARVLTEVFDQTAASVDNVTAALRPFLEGLRTLIDIFAPEIERMTAGLAEGAENFRDWAAAAQESGQAVERFRQAAEFMATLGQIVGGAFRLIDAGIRASHDAGVDLFQTVADLIDQAADLSETVEAQEGLQQFFQSIDQLIRALLPVLGAAAVQIGRLTTPLADLVTALAPGAKAVFEGLADGLIALVDSGGEDFMEALSDALIIAAPHLQVLGEALGRLLGAVSPLLDPLGRFVGFLLELAGGVAELLIPFIEPLTTFLSSILTPLFEALLGLAEAALPPLADAFQRVSDKVSPLIEQIGDFLLEYVEDSLPFAIGILVGVIEGLIFVMDLWFDANEIVLGVLKDIWGWIQDNIIPVIRDELMPVIYNTLLPALKAAKDSFDELWDAIEELWEELSKLIKTIIEDVDPELENFDFLIFLIRVGILQWIAIIKVVAGILKMWVTAMQPVIRSFKTMADGIRSVRDRYNQLKDAIKAAIAQIKGIIDRGLRAVSVLKSMGSAARNLAGDIADIPSLPSGLGRIFDFFADGGIVTSATAAIIGEAGPEVVLPLTQPRRARQLAAESGLMDVLLGDASGGTPAARSAGRSANSGAGVVVQAGAVVIKFEGVPDEQRARRVGNAAGEGLLNTLAARNVRLAVRGF